MSKNQDWFQKYFPTAQARNKADKVIDHIDPGETMTTFIDVWIAAYVEAGGKTPIPFESLT